MLAEKIKLEDDEIVLEVVRKHWFILFMELFGLVVAAALPLGAYLMLSHSAISFGMAVDIGAYTTTLFYGYTVWLFVIWMLTFNIWTNYYLDVWTITNRRIIAVDQRGLFSRTTGSFRLERLQDMNVEIHGIIATLLDFGTLEAQTAAGSEEEFRATGLPRPQQLKAIILETTDQLIWRPGPDAHDSSGA